MTVVYNALDDVFRENSLQLTAQQLTECNRFQINSNITHIMMQNYECGAFRKLQNSETRYQMKSDLVPRRKRNLYECLFVLHEDM